MLFQQAVTTVVSAGALTAEAIATMNYPQLVFWQATLNGMLQVVKDPAIITKISELQALVVAALALVK